jgi:hypothetical protein
MPRFLKVKGKPGVLVSNPHAHGANPRRYAGKRLIATPEPIPNLDLVDRFEDVEELMQESPALRAAIKAGELELVGECVAKDHACAHSHPAMAAKPSKAAAKGAE